MIKPLRALSSVCFALLLLPGCSKEERKQSTYTFINSTGRRITFDVYARKEDYYLNANRVQQHLIEPGANLQVAFESLKTYWIDWYSEGYLLNNWRSPYGNAGFYTNPPAEVSVAAIDDTYNLATNLQDTAKSVLINGDGVSSTWAATIANSVSLNGTHRFLFKKDFGGEYTYTDEDGIARTQPIRYYIRYNTGTSADRSFGMTILNEQLEDICDAECFPKVFAGQHTGRDTLLFSFRQFGANNVPAVRQ